jgi:hypothetical protein
MRLVESPDFVAFASAPLRALLRDLPEREAHRPPPQLILGPDEGTVLGAAAVYQQKEASPRIILDLANLGEELLSLAKAKAESDLHKALVLAVRYDYPDDLPAHVLHLAREVGLEAARTVVQVHHVDAEHLALFGLCLDRLGFTVVGTLETRSPPEAVAALRRMGAERMGYAIHCTESWDLKSARPRARRPLHP